MDYADPKTGISKRQHLQKVFEQTNILPKDLDIPPMSFEVNYLFQLFWDVYRRDGILWSEIVGYQEYYGIPIPPDELQIIKGLAKEVTAWLNQKEKASNKKPKSSKRKPRGR